MYDRMKSCKERIHAHLQDRIKDVEQALKAEENEYGKIVIDGEEYEDLFDWINQYALVYSDDPHYRAKRLELSWGGPQDYFLFFEDGTIEYHFLDWFDGAKIELQGKQYEIMRELFERCLNF